MTVDSRPERSGPAVEGPSIHVLRARRLLLGGAVGGLAASLICLLGFGIGYGGRGVVSAGLASAMVLFFYGVGQLVMVQFADAGARTLLVVSLCSYTTRVAVLGMVLLFYERQRENWPNLVPMAIFVTTMAVVAGWLVVEVFVFSRLRIGVYDTEYTPPVGRVSEP